MAAWWASQAKNGWRMSYTGDNESRAKEVASERRKEGKQAKVVRKSVNSLAGKSYMEYVTLTKDK